MQLTEETILQQSQNIVQPKKALKVSYPESSRPHDKFIQGPQTRSRYDSKSKTISREYTEH